MAPTVPPHWIKANETTRQPRRWVWLDCEAGQVPTPAGWVQSWALGVTAFDNRDPGVKAERPTEWATHTDTAELWRWVDERCAPRRRTVVVAHNLGYDLRISRAFHHLPELGWTLEGVRLDGGQAWATWRGVKGTLTMIDSLSWLPASLETLGQMVGLTKPQLPSWDAPGEDWAARCRADVEILRAACLHVWEWLERADLGVWQMTGAGMSWAAWRHRFMTHRVLVHSDPEAKAAERGAAWSGRCEAWRWGERTGGPYVEWDLECAYAEVARTCTVPTRPLWRSGRLSADQVRAAMRTKAVLCKVEVTTDVPVVPTSHDGRIVWPVGTFTTTLWDPELRLLDQAGASWRPLDTWAYLAEPALQTWAEWVIGLAQGQGDGADPLIRLVGKHWSRALIGRFGLRYGRWAKWGTSPVVDVLLLPGVNLVTREAYRILQVGRDLYNEEEPVDADNAVPAVMSWVMSECRRRLWEAMTTAGLDQVLYIDTDSLITTPEGSDRLQAALDGGWPMRLRRKGLYRRLTIHGPRQLATDNKLRAAGIPAGAERVGLDTWEATVWRSLAHSIKLRAADRVFLDRRTIHLRGTDNRRSHLTGGGTAPLVLGGLDGAGEPGFVPVPIAGA